MGVLIELVEPPGQRAFPSFLPATAAKPEMQGLFCIISVFLPALVAIPFALLNNQPQQPCNDAVDHRRHRAVDQYRPGDDEHLHAGA